MQDYKFVTRSVWAGANQFAPDGSLLLQNAAEFLDYLNEMYLKNGYTLLSVSFLGEYLASASDPNTPRGYTYTWHLVKEYEPAPSKKKVDDK